MRVRGSWSALKKAERAGVALEGAVMRKCVCDQCERLRESGAEADYFFMCECGETAVFIKVENDFCTYSNYACAACFAEDFDPDLFGDGTPTTECSATTRTSTWSSPKHARRR